MCDRTQTLFLSLCVPFSLIPSALFFVSHWSKMGKKWDFTWTNYCIILFNTTSYYLLVIPLSIFFALSLYLTLYLRLRLLLRFWWCNLKVQYLNKDKDWFYGFQLEMKCTKKKLQKRISINLNVFESTGNGTKRKIELKIVLQRR